MKIFWLSFLLSFSVISGEYPKNWWVWIDPTSAPSWEILPQEAKAGEVILSKRTELGVFSNFALAPFCLDNSCYRSIEGFWQMMKYPEGINDFRNSFEYPFDRKYVSQLWGKKAKEAGKVANRIMKENGFNLISYSEEFFDYKDMADGSDFHYQIIFRAIREKVIQNEPIKKLLLKTGNLILRPDHYQGARPQSYYYHDILMLIREELRE